MADENSGAAVSDIQQSEVTQPEYVDEHDKICQELLPKLKLKIGSLEINGRTLMVAMRYAMELVELTKVKGEEQKQIVLKLLRYIVRDAPLSEKKEKLCLKLINGGIVGQTIDLIVDATHGNLNINNVAEFAGTAAETLVETRCCGLFGRN